MTDHTNEENTSLDSGEQKDSSNKPNIQPSEIGGDGEDNAPGRTPGKAEGSEEIVEEDLNR